MLARTPDDEPKMTRKEAREILAKWRHRPDGPFLSLNGWAMAEITQALAALRALGLRPPIGPSKKMKPGRLFAITPPVEKITTFEQIRSLPAGEATARLVRRPSI